MLKIKVLYNNGDVDTFVWVKPTLHDYLTYVSELLRDENVVDYTIMKQEGFNFNTMVKES